MTDQPRYSVPHGDSEIREYARVMAQSFAGPPEAFEEWAVEFGADNVRVMRDEAKAGVRGGLVIYRMGQYFGGRSVPTWGIAGVAVRPELRGQGVAREMMLANLREHYEQGPPLSTLWPATTQLYRSLGWETCGSRNTYRVRCSELPRDKVDASIRPATEEDTGLIREMYAQRHGGSNGCLDRSEQIWSRVERAPKGTPLYRYIVECDGRPEGYFLYVQKREGDTGYIFNLLLNDFVALSERAARRIVATFAAHRSVAEDLQFFGAPNDPMLQQVLNSQKVRVHERLDWMLRVVRVKDALEARGYPRALTGQATVEVVDEQLPENSGAWTIGFENGAAQVGQGGDAKARIHIRGLNALYTGRLLPRELRLAGLLEGDESGDDLLTAAFAGSPPWMPDFF